MFFVLAAALVSLKLPNPQPSQAIAGKLETETKIIRNL